MKTHQQKLHKLKKRKAKDLKRKRAVPEGCVKPHQVSHGYKWSHRRKKTYVEK